MQVTFSPKAKEDLDYWIHSNKAISRKIVSLIDAIMLSPFEGIGKPEPLKHNLSGCWSRRINKEHRLVYEVSDDIVLFFLPKGIIHNNKGMILKFVNFWLLDFP